MKIFNYDEDGTFTGASDAHPNPEEKDKFLIPKRASTMSPPTHDMATHRAVYQGSNKWHVVRRIIVKVNAQNIEVRSDQQLKIIAQELLHSTNDEILEHFENCTFPPDDIVMYRCDLRKVIRGQSTQLPRLVRLPKWPLLKGNK